MGYGRVWWDRVGYGGTWWDMVGYDGTWSDMGDMQDIMGYGGIWWDMIRDGRICRRGPGSSTRCATFLAPS